MNRRKFLNHGLAMSSLLALAPINAMARLQPDEQSLCTDSGGADGEEIDGRPDMHCDDGLIFATGALKYLPFEYVTSHISPFLEQHFDLFVFINTSERKDYKSFVNSQHLKIVQRTGRAGSPIFIRNSWDNNINSLSPINSTNAVIWKSLPVSTGTGRGKSILTYSGVFRVNVGLSRQNHRPTYKAYMSWSSYIDYVYATGRTAHVAIHGTPDAFPGKNQNDNWRKLGVQRASEGCCRVHPAEAIEIQAQLIGERIRAPQPGGGSAIWNNPRIWSSTTPKFDRRSAFPSAAVQSGALGSEPGPRALIVTFESYSTRSS